MLLSASYDRGLMFSELAPVVVFAYNRPHHLRRTLAYLEKNTLADQSRLFIFCDGAKEQATEKQRADVVEAQQVAHETTWAGGLEVVVSPKNQGLARSVIAGVSAVLEDHESVIVLEDDLLVGMYFLEFMNEALRRYSSDESVMQVSGFTFPIGMPAENGSFFMPATNTIGWATWKRVWSSLDTNAAGSEAMLKSKQERHRFNVDGTYDCARLLKRQLARKSSNDSWGILFWWLVFRNKGIVLFPDYPLIQHKDDGSLGVHKSDYRHYDTANWNPNYRVAHYPDKLEVEQRAFTKFKRYLQEQQPSTYRRVIKKLKLALGYRD